MKNNAQHEAKRLYKLFYKASENYDFEVNETILELIAKESAILCAKERQKVMVNTCESDVWIESSKKFYRDVIRELNKL